jgi:hypothetical protein
MKAPKGWTASRQRCVKYAIKLIDETIAKVRADLEPFNDEGTLQMAEVTWRQARSMLLGAPGVLKARRAETERTRERKRGAGPRVPRHWVK